jgi:acyl-coenzyme A synthetase/AMP-(fatty) acid ligase/thioesterase domain-containing protein
VIDQLQAMALRRSERTAITAEDSSLTYGELWDGLSGLAEILAARTSAGGLVGIELPASPLYTLAVLACLGAGRPFVALDPGYPAEWREQVLEEARPELVIGRQGGVGRLALDAPPAAAGPGWRPAPLGLDEPACVLFTSGSTGRPKGIVNSQRALLQRAAQSINAAHINGDDRLLTLASHCSIVGVRDILTALLAGAAIHLLDPHGLGARRLSGVIRAEAISILFAFPALLRSALAHPGERAGPSLRLVRLGGETTLWSDIDRLRAWLAPGSAIQLIFAATEAPMMQWFVSDACRGPDPRVPIGFALPGNRLALVDEAGRSVAPGQVGELVTGGPFVALGRWEQGRFVAAEAGGAERRFHTGDLARLRPDGLIEPLGRKDRQVKIRGVRVELEAVEAALRRHRQVADVGVLARVGGEDEDASLIAYVSAAGPAGPALLDELKAMMRRQPAAMRPARIYLTDEIPRLPNSKLDARALAAVDAARLAAERARAGAHATLPLDGADAIERAAALAWRAVLGAPATGLQEDFFDAGGDSLKAIALMIELEGALGAELPLTLINEAPTFGALCEALRRDPAADYAPLVLLRAGDEGPPVFIVHGVGGAVTDLFPIARSMTYAGPVFGIQARGLARKQVPHPSVQAMAEDYLAEVRARQPQGPYQLCGYSFGGLVAFEMAVRLKAAGQEVGLVGLFDTLTSPAAWSVRAWLAFLVRRAAQLSGQLAEGGWLGGLGRRGRKLAPAGMLRVAANGLMASARYRPGFYAGELTLFTPRDRDEALPSPASIWRTHAGTVSMVDLPGAHLTMMAPPHAEQAAAALSRRLRARLGKLTACA